MTQRGLYAQLPAPAGDCSRSRARVLLQPYLAVFVLTLAAPAAGQPAEPAAAPAPALTLELRRPDIQCDRLLALFQGARVPHPAAALAAWKRATGGRGTLGKSWEAAIAALNPQMAPEYRLLDRARLGWMFDAEDRGGDWSLRLPRDDGSFADLAVALALTEGGPEPPLEGVAVDRLGPEPWPLAAVPVPAGGLVLASSRAALRRALLPVAEPMVDAAAPGLDTGWLLRLDSNALDRAGAIVPRRVAGALLGLGYRHAFASLGLEGEVVSLTLSLPRVDPLPPAATIDWAWLDALPLTGIAAAFALAIDPGPGAWERLFAAVDQVERADPAHANVAPLRTRLNLMAAAAKVWPERDLWPHLRGLSGALLVDRAGQPQGVLIGLHTDAPESADQIAGQVLPALAPMVGIRPGLAEPPPPQPPPAGVRRLGVLRDRPVFVARAGSAVRIGWGSPALEPLRAGTLAAAARASHDPPDAALGFRGSPSPQRFVSFWPGRLDLTNLVGAPLAAALAGSPAIVWSGRDAATGTSEVIRWPGLHGLVERFLDRLPLEAAPER